MISFSTQVLIPGTNGKRLWRGEDFPMKWPGCRISGFGGFEFCSRSHPHSGWRILNLLVIEVSLERETHGVQPFGSALRKITESFSRRWSSDVRKAEIPHPLYFASGKGSHIWDVDGNELYNYCPSLRDLCCWGIVRRLYWRPFSRQLQKGLMYAAQHEAELELAELLTRLIPCAQRVRFNSTGSEAVTLLRVARAYRNRKFVVKFEGQWHGWYDSLFVSTAPPLEQAGPYHEPRAILPSRGQVANAADNFIILPWNDSELVKQVFARRGQEIAAVLTEPVMCNSGSILPRSGFLEGLRELCTQNESALIFDEVITGFRIALGALKRFLASLQIWPPMPKGLPLDLL